MRFAVFILLGLVSGAAHAHDFWIEPASFSVAPGDSLKVSLRVGHADDVKSISRKPDRILRFEALAPGGASKPIEGPADAEPAGTVALEAPGFHTLVYESNHAYIELEAEKFERYLESEGLSYALGLRKGEKGPGKESYARYCKSLVRVGKGDDGWDKDLGLPFEFVPLVAPTRGALAFRLEYENQPLSDARVELLPLDDLTKATVGKTDAGGVVRFESVEAGRYMVASTHMVQATSRVRGDWESFWATLSFQRD